MPRLFLSLLIRFFAIVIGGVIIASFIFGSQTVFKTIEPLWWPEDKPVMILAPAEVTDPAKLAEEKAREAKEKAPEPAAGTAPPQPAAIEPPAPAPAR